MAKRTGRDCKVGINENKKERRRMMRYNNNNTQQEIVVTLTSIEDDLDTNKKKKEIEIGLDFILSHLEEPTIFPRTIMTKKLGYQQMVYSKERALEHFIESDFIDCRINAFPSLKEGATWMPELLFIDLDLSDFNTKRSLQIVLNKTLKSIKEKLDKNAHPTVLWSGNGYHIILPVSCPGELERIQQFQGFTTTSKPSEEFLRFAKDYLSNGKADKSNYPSFRSCLLRIPNSLNGKCLARRGESLENSIVKIIQKWNGYRPPVVELLYDFRRYLIQKKIDDYNYKQKLLVANKKRNKNDRYYYPTRNHDNNYYYEWIETILQTPFEDCRKIISSLILAPYLINVKKLPFQECYKIIKEWLDKCDSLEKLYDSGGFNSRVSYSLKNAENKQIGPMSQYKIKTDSNYSKLYILLKKKGILK